MSILVVAEHENSKIKAATLNTIAAGVAIGGDIHIWSPGKIAPPQVKRRRKLPVLPKC